MRNSICYKENSDKLFAFAFIMKKFQESSDRKKETHLRCERQRREAINSGYQKLKDLLPQSLSPVGCKTTNAAILFRTVDYINQLKGDIESIDTNLSQLASQVSTLELIIKEYENMSAASSIEPNNLVQCNVIKTFLDLCFQSFRSQINVATIQTMTKTLLPWVEQLDYENIAAELIVSIYGHQCV